MIITLPAGTGKLFASTYCAALFGSIAWLGTLAAMAITGVTAEDAIGHPVPLLVGGVGFVVSWLHLTGWLKVREASP